MPTQFFWETEPEALSMLRVSSTTEPWEATAKGFQQLIVVGVSFEQTGVKTSVRYYHRAWTWPVSTLTPS